MLELKNITKLFPGVRALDDVSATFATGEIHALMGENGAGKSTVVKIITGTYQPDLGEIYLDGKPVKMRNFQDAIDHAISVVAQEIQVIPGSTVAENIVLDKITDFRTGGKINWKKVNETAKTYLEMVGLDIEPTDKIGGLTAAQKQLIQIAKAVSANARFILMDEPTSSLTKYETEILFGIARKLKAQGVGIIFISHKIEEIIELCDKVTVLRDGKLVGTIDCTHGCRPDIIHMMIDRAEATRHLGYLEIGEETALEAKDVTVYGQFDKINFQLKKGEILGFYGLVGSGRTELARLLIGAERIDEGEIWVDGRRAEIRSIQDSLERYNVGYVTENRKEEGLILEDSVARNLTITTWNQMTNRLGKISTKKDKKIVDTMIDRMQVKTPSPETKIKFLSGGNQQKVSIGKWLTAGCDVLIIDEPTVGVDIGAKEYIHQLIWDLAEKEGKSIILISSDMPEMITLARRILIFRDFQIAGEISGLNDSEVDHREVSKQIGEVMA